MRSLFVEITETNNQDIVADGEEDVFRDRKHKILAGDGMCRVFHLKASRVDETTSLRSSCSLSVIEEEMTPSSEFSASSEHDDDEETGDSESSDRPTSPRAAPVGTDADHRYRSPVRGLGKRPLPEGWGGVMGVHCLYLVRLASTGQ